MAEAQLLYRDLAPYYDLIYDWKKYRKEAGKLYRIIRRHKRSAGKDLLDVACGTGGHLVYLQKHFTCTGIDIHEDILSIARKKLPSVRFKTGNMMIMDLQRKFDVLTCLFSSIGYVRSKANLKKTMRVFTRHLAPGGVLIVEGWLEPDVYEAGNPGMKTYESDVLKIARLDCGKRKGGLSIMDMHFLVAERDKDVRHVVDRHEMGLFIKSDVIAAMEQAGLQATTLESGLMRLRNLYIGVKPLQP